MSSRTKDSPTFRGRAGGAIGPGVGLSLQAADLARALERLAVSGWTLLEDQRGDYEIAGQTADGRRAVCLYAERSPHEQLFLEDLHRGLAALHTAADLQHAEPS
jgi:hypothetical protein